MRRTWNSWTYYGPGGDSGGDDDQETICQQSGKSDLQRSKDKSKGSLAAAFEPSMANSLERAMDLCDVRKERVARVKQAIASGGYRVASRDLARKLIENMLGEYR